MTRKLQTDVAILGGGIAGLSLAAFLNRQAVVLEKSPIVGGLSRSYKLNGIAYDVGPHIIFSKNKEVLDLHTSIVPTHRLRRSNQILLNGRLVKYPFENDLAALEPADRDYCLTEYLNNPYENYTPSNMMQFFLRTFGEGITQLYLRPYNEKIWKFDPACMDTQMVERIPKPPREDVIKSAAGQSTEGYIHQLYFYYPKQGGFQSIIDEYSRRAETKGNLVQRGCEVLSLQKVDSGWEIVTSAGRMEAKHVISCMPIHDLVKCLEAPAVVKETVDRLLYNSIHVVILQFRKDRVGDHFAFYIPDADIIFHRLSKLNFLGPAYCLDGEAVTLMAEVTFRPGSYVGSLSRDEIIDRVLSGLEKLDLVDRKDFFDATMHTEKYSYVIYDLDHRRNTDFVLDWVRNQGIDCLGRFGEFEYLNTDGVVERSITLAKNLNASI